ncbi:hypothetical protein GCK32_013234, partial [Trichostrongylus colubriformis]
GVFKTMKVPLVLVLLTAFLMRCAVESSRPRNPAEPHFLRFG